MQFSYRKTISLTQKLFGDNNPYFRIVSAILFVAAVIQLTGSLSSTGNANSVFESVLSTDQVNSVANVGQLVTFILFGIWALCLISADENNLVPSWGRLSGQGAAYLVILVQIGALFGLVPINAFVPVFMEVYVTEKMAVCLARSIYANLERVSSLFRYHWFRSGFPAFL